LSPNSYITYFAAHTVQDSDIRYLTFVTFRCLTFVTLNSADPSWRTV